MEFLFGVWASARFDCALHIMLWTRSTLAVKKHVMRKYLVLPIIEGVPVPVGHPISLEASVEFSYLLRKFFVDSGIADQNIKLVWSQLFIHATVS